jgi:lipopolysaccharide export system protein LptA
MVCRADSIEYDRNAMLLALIGNSEVTWKNDSYRSSVTTINLQTDEIVMEGTIKGTVNG